MIADLWQILIHDLVFELEVTVKVVTKLLDESSFAHVLSTVHK